MFNDSTSARAVDAPTGYPSTHWARLEMPADLTVIDELPTRIPSDLTVTQSRFWSTFVLLLDEFNLLKKSDWAGREKHIDQIALSAMSRWLSKQSNNLKHLNASFLICGDLKDCHVVEMESVLLERHIDPQQFHAAFALSSAPIDPIAVEPAISTLENALPGLGETVLFEIARAGWKTIPVFTPAMTLDVISEVYWYGEDNERMAMEEMRDQGMSEAEIASSDLRTRASLENAIPTFALAPKERFTTQELEAFQQQHGGWIAAVIDALIALRQFSTLPIDFFPGTGMQERIIGVGAFLHWNINDPSMQAYDDFANYWFDTGDACTELFGIEVVAMTREGMQQFLQSMTQGFELLRRLDRLIGHIASSA